MILGYIYIETDLNYFKSFFIGKVNFLSHISLFSVSP